MKTKKESKTKTPQLEVVNDIFMVEKNSRRLVSLKPDIKEAPENMVIPEGIEIIGPAIFVSKNKFQCSNIKSVKFPDSLKKIENNAFFRCTNLTDIQFGNGLEYIGKIAFASCRGLEKIVLPDSLRVIESQAFMDCSKLKNVVFNEGLQVIEWSAFYICKNLNEFVLPKSLRVVGDEALQYAKKVTIHGELPHNLMRAVSPMSWTTHSEYTSRKWPMVVELVADDDTYFLPKYIELANASDCECALNSGIQEKMQTLYKYCNSGDASADTAYAEYIHLLKTGEGCKAKSAAGLDEMRIAMVQEAAFVNSGFLDQPFVGGIKCLGPFIIDIDETADEIVLPKSDVSFCVKKRPKKAVRVPNLNAVAALRVLPKKVIIEDEKINYDDALLYKLYSQDIEEIESHISRYKTVDGIVYSADMKTLILCPQGKTGEVIIPDGVVRIRKSAFSNSKIKKVIFPDTMQTIGDEAFYACEKLKEIDFGHGITRIGENGNQHMFSGCAFKKITFPPQIKEIGISAFSLCRELEEVIFNEGLEVIQKEAFQNCQNLLEINLPASIKKVGMDAFVCNARRDKIQDMNINMTTIPEGLALAIIRPGNIHRTRCINVHIDNQDGIFNFVLPCSISATASVYGAYSNIVNVFNQMAYRGHDKKLWNLKCLETAYLHASYPRYVYVVAYKTYRKTKNKYTKEFLADRQKYVAKAIALEMEEKDFIDFVKLDFINLKYDADIVKCLEKQNWNVALAYILEEGKNNNNDVFVI